MLKILVEFFFIAGENMKQTFSVQIKEVKETKVNKNTLIRYNKSLFNYCFS